jgi:hypothetical protein
MFASKDVAGSAHIGRKLVDPSIPATAVRALFTSVRSPSRNSSAASQMKPVTLPEPQTAILLLSIPGTQLPNHDHATVQPHKSR